MARRWAEAGALAFVLSVSPLAGAAGEPVPGACGASSPQGAHPPGRGRLLVATPNLLDPNFERSVVLLLDADATGAVGVVVNRPSPIELHSVLPGVAPAPGRREHLFLGGPVGRFQLLLLVRTGSPPAESLRIFEDVYATASREALSEALASGRSSTRFRLFAGYAGWAAGQLEAEIARGDWRVLPGDAERVFAEDPAGVWDELIGRGKGRWVDRGPLPDFALAQAEG